MRVFISEVILFEVALILCMMVLDSGVLLFLELGGITKAVLI